jgi:hypothetical protein
VLLADLRQHQIYILPRNTSDCSVRTLILLVSSECVWFPLGTVPCSNDKVHSRSLHTCSFSWETPGSPAISIEDHNHVGQLLLYILASVIAVESSDPPAVSDRTPSRDEWGGLANVPNYHILFV